jgi:hypothetical protein
MPRPGLGSGARKKTRAAGAEGHKTVGLYHLISAVASVSVTAFFTVGRPAFALDVEQCSLAQDIMMPHEGEDDYEDLGSSLVAYQRGGGFEGRGITYVYFVRCSSGETLSVVGAQYDGSSKDFFRADEAQGLIRGLVASETIYSFNDAKDTLTSAGFEVDLTTANEEVCACKALYPSDRRGKKPYVFRSIVFTEPATNGDDE